MNHRCLAAGLGLLVLLVHPAPAQEETPDGPVRSSLVEDRAARQLIEAGDARFEADETSKALEIWQSVIERYPRSRLRFEAHMRLGNYYLNRDRAYDRARTHFQAVQSEENSDEEARAEATLQVGVCFYEARNFGMAFQIMRDVIERYPVSEQVNRAYYYIGLGHFELGHYSRAIDALEKVGTSLSKDDAQLEKLEAGKRLFVKVEDADLAALEAGQIIKLKAETSSGDTETIDCFPVGRNVRIVLGNIPTKLGKPNPGNGTLEVKGDDKVQVTYTDSHTADKKFDRPVLKDVGVVGDAIVSVTDGAYRETLKGVVLGKTINVQIADMDRDLTDAAETVTATIEVLRRKTDEELENEALKAAQENGGSLPEGEQPKIDPLKPVDKVTLTLTEAEVATEINPGESSGLTAPPDTGEQPAAAQPAPMTSLEQTGIHTGTFRTTLSLENSEEVKTDDNALQALTGDVIRITYSDERNTSDSVQTILSDARAVDGNLGGVRVTKAVITDRELRIQTQLKTASALTNIGNRYKDFGLKSNAQEKYKQALDVCDLIIIDARQLGGHLLEETYVQLWKIYFEMDQLELAAAMCQRLQREFPESAFVDDALLQLADVAREGGNLPRAIGIYNRLVSMETSQLRGEAQFGIAQCYDTMAEASTSEAATIQLRDRAFQEYKKVFDNHPESGRVGEAVAKMANYYYLQKDYGRAVDTFESVLSAYPDAKFLDVILFNYGRCLYRMGRQREARQKFDQLIGEFPESPLAADAKKISDALARSGF